MSTARITPYLTLNQKIAPIDAQIQKIKDAKAVITKRRICFFPLRLCQPHIFILALSFLGMSMPLIVDLTIGMGPPVCSSERGCVPSSKAPGAALLGVACFLLSLVSVMNLMGDDPSCRMALSKNNRKLVRDALEPLYPDVMNESYFDDPDSIKKRGLKDVESRLYFYENNLSKRREDCLFFGNLPPELQDVITTMDMKQPVSAQKNAQP